MSLITIRTSNTRVDAYLSGIFAMAEAVLANDEGIDSEEHWFTVSIAQEDNLDDSTGENPSKPITDGADAAVEKPN